MIHLSNLSIVLLLIPSFFPSLSQKIVPDNPRAMAEWEEVEAVVINLGDFVWQSWIDV